MLRRSKRSAIPGMWPDSDETQRLLDQARAGDADAVEQLLDRHRGALERLVRMRLDRRIVARVGISDVVQEALLEAGRRLRGYLGDPKLAFHLWLRQITRDRIIDAHRRHRGTARRSVDRESPNHIHATDDRSALDLLGQIQDRELTPAGQATHQEMVRRVEDAIATLPETDAEILVMRHYEQLTNQEIAAALDLTEPAASMRYLRAVRRLREQLIGSVDGSQTE